MILQLLGMAKGANVSAHDLYLLNMQGDLGDLMNGKNGYTHCSALLKYLGDELHVAHTTWYYYSSMYRIYKTMDLAFVGNNNTQAFSSYPGLIVSLDDFYIVKSSSGNLVITETTNDIFNTSLYSNLSIQSVPYLFRVTMANRYATNGTTWLSLFSEYNSGTYNNGWLIVEMSGNMSNDRIYLLEQIPGYIETADITDIVRGQSYWASYNIPYFPYIYNVSGYLQMYQKHGVEYSYTNCSRANIFRAKHKFIRNTDDMKYLMQYNNYQNEPLSNHNPTLTISSRYDLLTAKPELFGGIDSKVTSSKLVNGTTYGSAWIISGPTHESEPIFTWKGISNEKTPHYLQPTSFNFTYILV
jgi:hypothetical protein